MYMWSPRRNDDLIAFAFVFAFVFAFAFCVWWCESVWPQCLTVSGYISFLLPKLPSQCNTNGPGNMGSLSSSRNVQVNLQS